MIFNLSFTKTALTSKVRDKSLNHASSTTSVVTHTSTNSQDCEATSELCHKYNIASRSEASSKASLEGALLKPRSHKTSHIVVRKFALMPYCRFQHLITAKLTS